MDSSIRICYSCKWWKENGDGTQKVCEVCTPDIAGEFPPDDDLMVNYPNDDESGTFENAVPWRDVDRNHWLRINASFHVNTIHGPATIVTLQKRNGITIKAWTTNTITDALRANDSVKCEKNLFIKSLGLKKGKDNKNSYYNFQFKSL